MLLIVSEVDEIYSAAEAVVYVMPNFLLVLSLLALSVCIRVEIKFQAPHAVDATLDFQERFAMAECVFSLLYMGLLLAELLVKPFDEYWLSKTNRFDFVATIILFVAATVWVLPFVHISRDTLHYLTILRLARLVLMLLKLPSYELLGICLMKMLPASVGVMGIMYVAGGLWSTLGVQLFGGTVYDGNPALEGTDYMEEGYDILNNNDYAMAFMSLFTFITAGPYHEFIEAAEAAIPVVGYLYHVSFYIVGILIVKEGLIVAFIVDAFLSQFEDNRALCEDENIASLDQSRAGEGFRIIASKRSSKDDIYRAMFLEDDD